MSSLKGGSRSSPSQTGCDSKPTGRRISGLLAVCFLLASLLALYEVAQIPRLSSDTPHASKSVETIREFYAALNAYLETGDAGAVSEIVAPGALAFVPEQGAMGPDSGLLTYLLALRSTLPELRFTIDRIDAGDDIAIASVRMSGIADVSALGLPATPAASREFFRVRDGRIVEHWTTTPESVLLHPLTSPPMQIETRRPGRLAIADLTFTPNQHSPQTIDGPALVIVESGRLTLTGDGATQILDIATGATSVPAANERVSAGPGRAISVPGQRALVENRNADVANARIATIVQDPRGTPVGMPPDRPLPPPAINDASMLVPERTTTNGAVTVHPLAFDDRRIPAGAWDLEIAWAVLGPGASLPLDDDLTLAHVISDSAGGSPQDRHASGTPDAPTNDTDTPVVALMIRLRAAP